MKTLPNNIKLPKWANYIAIDDDGQIWAYYDKPILAELEWYPRNSQLKSHSLYLDTYKMDLCPEDWTKELYLIKDDGTLERVEQ